MRNESECGDDIVFLSPEGESPPAKPDAGASPRLRRSSRKRKSTAGGEDSMSKGASSKKKKTSPNKSPNMPKVARSPAKGAQPPTTGTTPTSKTPQQGQSFEALLLAMEGRLSAKLEKASEASKEAANQAKLNSESLELLESRVDANEACLMEALGRSEARIMAKVQAQVEDLLQGRVKELVDAQLHAAGFDQDLTAGDLSLRNSVQVCNETSGKNSYAAAASQSSRSSLQLVTKTKEEKQDMKFWKARRSLRLWPIKDGSKEALENYLKDRLRLEEEFVREELGEVVLAKVREPKSKTKNKDEYVVIFENKQIRDTIKAAAYNLANHRNDAGMRLDVPDHLQKDFHTLMNLSFDLKKKHPELKRNVKFDEEDGGLFMDLKLNKDSE